MESQIFSEVVLGVKSLRTTELEQGCNDDVVMAFRSLLKARILIDFSYYKVMNDLSTFKMKWCSHDVLCTIAED